MSQGPLSGKVALITGGSKGIGKATTLALAQGGAKVVINYSSDAGAANELVEQLGGSGNALAIQANAGNLGDIDKIVQKTVAKFGKIDILVPNAGILLMKNLASTTEQDFDSIYAVNVKGPYFLAQKAEPHMSPGSHIVFLSTSLCAASSVGPDYLLYVSTKGAIEQMTRVLSKDLGRKGILVNAVAPGPTGTELFYKGKPESVLKAIAGMSPQNRIGTPEEIAEAITFMCGEGSRWIAGQVVRVNGGFA